MMDAIGSVTFNLTPVDTAAPTQQTYGATSAAFDISHFNAAYATAAQASSTAQSPGAAQMPDAPGQTSQASASESAGFRSVIASLEGLTANVANRTSDGVQQLFREQS
jgi:hypothetical protein